MMNDGTSSGQKDEWKESHGKMFVWPNIPEHMESQELANTGDVS